MIEEENSFQEDSDEVLDNLELIQSKYLDNYIPSQNLSETEAETLSHAKEKALSFLSDTFIKINEDGFSDEQIMILTQIP